MFSITQHGTTKQRARLDLDGYSYVKDRAVNEKIYWRCIKYSSDQCAHPTLWVFLQKLIDEENVIHANLVQINAGEPPRKKKINERLERCLINLLTASHDDISVQLNSIAHNIIL